MKTFEKPDKILNIAGTITIVISGGFGPYIMKWIFELPQESVLRDILGHAAGICLLMLPLLGIVRCMEWCIKRKN
jgi:hypothetical protein